MFAPAPPRCCTRSSTRKESETFSIFPSTNWSVNLPGKVIRWSVAIEPVTTTVMGGDSLRGTAATRSAGPRTGDEPRGASSVGVSGPGRSVGQRATQLHAELRRPDQTQQAPDGRAAGDDDVGEPGPRHDPRTAQAEAGHRHPGRPLPHRDGAGLVHTGLPGPGAQVVREPAQGAEGGGQPAGGTGGPERHGVGDLG